MKSLGHLLRRLVLIEGQLHVLLDELLVQRVSTNKAFTAQPCEGFLLGRGGGADLRNGHMPSRSH